MGVLLGFTVYIHWVRGAVNPADPISRLHGQFAGDLELACEAATRRVGDLWAFTDRKTVSSGPWASPWGLLCFHRHGDRESGRMRGGGGLP